MSTQEDLGLTSLQRRIVHAIAGDEDTPSTAVADMLDCSRSYVDEVRTDHQSAIESAAGLSEITYIPWFSNPYAIHFGKSDLAAFHLDEGDPLAITATSEGTSTTAYGAVSSQELSEEVWEQELRERLHGAYFAFEELQEYDRDAFETVPVLDGRADCSTQEELIELFTGVRQLLRRALDTEPVALVGVGILEAIYDERDPTQIAPTPSYRLETECIARYLVADTPAIESCRMVAEEITAPDDVFFTYYGAELTADAERQLREELLSHRYVKSNWNYVCPTSPHPTGPTTHDTSPEIIELTDEALRFVPGETQAVEFYAEDGSQISNLTADRIQEAIIATDPSFDSHSATRHRNGNGGNLPLRLDGDRLSLLFDQVTIELVAEEDHIVWNRPAEVENIEILTDAVNGMIESGLGVADHDAREPEQRHSEPITTDAWVFDTNALYHDHTDDQPTSILHTVLYHWFFADTTIHIPWPVLYEFNKHSSRGADVSAQNEQGFANLRLLRLLGDIGVFEFTVQSLPESIHGDISDGDIADLYVLAYAEQEDASLITGDHTLESLGEFVDADVVNVKHLKSVTSPRESGPNPEESVLPKIGRTVQAKSDIIERINKSLDSEAALQAREGSRLSPYDPEDILQRWVSTREITQYRKAGTDETYYGQRADFTLVPTTSAVTALEHYLEDGVLTERWIDEIHSELGQISSNTVPVPKVVVPTELVVSNTTSEERPNEFGIAINQLAGSPQVGYDVESAHHVDVGATLSTGASTETGLVSPDDVPAVQLAIALEDSKLLLAPQEEQLWKFGRMLNIDTLRLDAAGSE